MRSTTSPHNGEGKLQAFVENPLKKSWGITQPEHKKAKNIDRVANRTGYCHLKRYLFKLRLVNSPWCDYKCKQASETASYIFLTWNFGHIKIREPGLSFYETRWLWRHICQQDTALRSRCRTAEWMSWGAAQKIDPGCNARPSIFYSIPKDTIFNMLFCILMSFPIWVHLKQTSDLWHPWDKITGQPFLKTLVSTIISLFMQYNRINCHPFLL